ncbi:MAG TPA: hypothetical protein VHP14_26010 [Anaerolineales bacterium]|nr:hypothetical protein [Anaerolineales bacterium]
MNTNLSNHISDIEKEQEIAFVQYKPGEKVERRSVQILRPILKWFGILSTLAWGVAALSPETLRVPVHLQGWTFLVFIAWFFAYCAGAFNL